MQKKKTVKDLYPTKKIDKMFIYTKLNIDFVSLKKVNGVQLPPPGCKYISTNLLSPNYITYTSKTKNICENNEVCVCV